MVELLELFDELRTEIDAVPFAYEDYWTDRVGDLKEVTR